VSVMGPLKLDQKIVNRQGWVQLAAAIAIVAARFPWLTPGTIFSSGGNLSQLAGFAFLASLAVYLWVSSRWARDEIGEEALAEAHEGDVAAPIPAILAKRLGGLAAVVVAAQALVPIAVEAATRLGVPESVIAGTVVAFGTSLPELV